MHGALTCMKPSHAWSPHMIKEPHILNDPTIGSPSHCHGPDSVSANGFSESLEDRRHCTKEQYEYNGRDAILCHMYSSWEKREPQ